MMNTSHIGIILTVIACTFLTRGIAFFVFRPGKTVPSYIKYLGRTLPSAIFGMLVVYCYQNTNVLTGNHGIPEIAAGIIVALLHIWKRNAFLSIIGGTICYMVMNSYML